MHLCLLCADNCCGCGQSGYTMERPLETCVLLCLVAGGSLAVRWDAGDMCGDVQTAVKYKHESELREWVI